MPYLLKNSHPDISNTFRELSKVITTVIGSLGWKAHFFPVLLSDFAQAPVSKMLATFLQIFLFYSNKLSKAEVQVLLVLTTFMSKLRIFVVSTGKIFLSASQIHSTSLDFIIGIYHSLYNFLSMQTHKL